MKYNRCLQTTTVKGTRVPVGPNRPHHITVHIKGLLRDSPKALPRAHQPSVELTGTQVPVTYHLSLCQLRLPKNICI